ncbi:hypothetical protein DSO57_1030140 [Entomophthora muscae]|uniref:Uncharacterized protein n=1 Tax=Entomophthora muscae TaxID=34485 RepID=A0ACC2S339_9FUNG|nr:hypothetical protein DSO57_1030140 [Entomophthora muscae]
MDWEHEAIQTKSGVIDDFVDPLGVIDEPMDDSKTANVQEHPPNKRNGSEQMLRSPSLRRLTNRGTKGNTYLSLGLLSLNLLSLHLPLLYLLPPHSISPILEGDPRR